MKNICVFGDSIVFGANDQKNGGWVNLLRKYKKSEYNIINLGISGDTSYEVFIRFEREVKNNSADTIILSVGLNDSMLLQSTGTNQVILVNFLDNIEKIFDFCQKNNYQIIITGILPVDERKTKPIPWHLDGSYITTEIKKYNQALQKFCQNKDIIFIDLFGHLSDDREYMASLKDGVHPNAIGHEKIFKIIKNNIWK